MNDCSILVNSCDRYKEAWFPFFTLLSKYWPDCPYKLYLNTESIQFANNKVVTLNSNKADWSGRLINCLERIESNYVLLALEDFFLMDSVNDKAISEILDIMKADKSIAVVYPKKISDFHSRDDINPQWIRMDFDSSHKYLINFQFGIWNRKALLNLIIPGLSPWKIERDYILPLDNQYKFYCLPTGTKFSCKGDIFPYLFAIQKGYGIAQSKWLWNNKKFFKKENIIVNFEELGVMSYIQYLFNKVTQKIRLIINRK